MKRGKLLLAIPAIVPIACVASCGNNNVMIYEDVEEAIFGPHDGKPETPHPDCATFYDCLDKASDKERRYELLYAIYAPLFYLKSDIPPFDTTPIYDLWKDQTLLFSANISKCSLDVKEDKVTANYVGYINFIFQKDWNDFKINDFMQFTLLLDNEPVTPKSNNWYLHFNNMPGTGVCWGFAQIHQGDTSKLFYLEWIGNESDFASDYPLNYHNWVQE